MPAARYPQIAPEVQALAEKYGLEYNTGSLTKQLGSVWLKIAKLALPEGPLENRRVHAALAWRGELGERADAG